MSHLVQSSAKRPVLSLRGRFPCRLPEAFQHEHSRTSIPCRNFEDAEGVWERRSALRHRSLANPIPSTDVYVRWIDRSEVPVRNCVSSSGTTSVAQRMSTNLARPAPDVRCASCSCTCRRRSPGLLLFEDVSNTILGLAVDFGDEATRGSKCTPRPRAPFRSNAILRAF